jgi:hypothetical protein
MGKASSHKVNAAKDSDGEIVRVRGCLGIECLQITPQKVAEKQKVDNKVD